jgi:sulfite exporter TauE/SafE
VFSGIASSCCAPVLAGVMTLSALAGSPVGGALLGLAFVLGMTFPLFVMALAWDRFRLRERSWLKARPVRLRLAGRTLVTNTVNVAVAVAFAVMGGFVIYLASADTMTAGPGFQAAIGRWLSDRFEQVQQWLTPVPEPVLGFAVLGIAGVFVWATLTDRHRTDRGERPSHEPNCHEHHRETLR